MLVDLELVNSIHVCRCLTSENPENESPFVSCVFFFCFLFFFGGGYKKNKTVKKVVILLISHEI